MSIMVRQWLKFLGLFDQTTHEDRTEIDREIEKRTKVNCDEALNLSLIDHEEFKSIVSEVLKKRKKQEALMVV